MWINLILNHSNRPEVDDADHEDSFMCLSSASSPAKGTKSSLRGLEDMKQRLRFLRRRHTDSSLSSKSKASVRPTPEQAAQWSESFETLMASRYGATLFKAFLSREYSQENVEFWMAVEEYKRTRPSKFGSKAKKIYEDFIAVKSAKEINVESKVRTDIKSNLTSPNSETFDVAQRKIQGLLESDAYLRFLQSSLYKQLLVPDVVVPTPTMTTSTSTAIPKLGGSGSSVTLRSATSGESVQSAMPATTGGQMVAKSASPPKSTASSPSHKEEEEEGEEHLGSSPSNASSYSSRSNSASSSPSLASSEDRRPSRNSHSSQENEESKL